MIENLIVSMESFIIYFSDYLFLVFLLSIFFNTICAVTGIIPNFWLTALNIAFFGPVGGFLVSIFGEAVGELCAFLIYRYLVVFVKKRSSKFTDNKYVKKIENGTRKDAMINIFIIRLIPFMPSEVANIGGALSCLNALEFTIASTIGKIPALLMEIALMYLVISNPGLLIVLAIIGVLLFLVKNRNFFKTTD